MKGKNTLLLKNQTSLQLLNKSLAVGFKDAVLKNPVKGAALSKLAPRSEGQWFAKSDDKIWFATAR